MTGNETVSSCNPWTENAKFISTDCITELLTTLSNKLTATTVTTYRVTVIDNITPSASSVL